MRFDTFPLTGGIDIVTPILGLAPGKALICINYELAPVSGYRRVRGYERFDGRMSPSDFEYGTAREAQRALIQAVPGSGPIRGVFILRGVAYAFRNTMDGMAKKLYRATSMGWVEVTTPTLLPGGRGEFIQNNFSGAAASLAIYGVDGINKAFQFDGTTYTQITTGSEPAVPSHVCEYKSHLFLAYPGGSLQFSGTGLPLDYTPLNGAGEIAVGDEIFSILELQGGALGVFCKDRIQILQGTSVDDFVLRQLSDTGVREWTVQPLFTDAIFLDKQVQRLSATDTFGDFQAGTLSESIRPFIELYLKNAQASIISRQRNQYYLFDNAKGALVSTFNDGRLTGWTRLSFSHQFVDSFAGEDIDGEEMILMAGEDGFVYRFNTGASFDGLPIDAILLLAPNHQRQFEIRKRYRKVVIESDSTVETALVVLAEFDYGSQPKSTQQQFTTQGQGGSFDFTGWDTAIWSADLKGYSTAYIAGHGRNIAVYVYNRSDSEVNFTLESMTIGYDIRGQVR